MIMQTELEERGGHFPKGLGGSALGVQQAVLLKVGVLQQDHMGGW